MIELVLQAPDASAGCVIHIDCDPKDSAFQVAALIGLVQAVAENARDIMQGKAVPTNVIPASESPLAVNRIKRGKA